MTLDSMESLEKCIHTGTYSTKINNPKRVWNRQQEGTFADYLSMKEGDHIYFFVQRKIYGIGKLVNIGKDCKYLNYVGADEPYDYTNHEISNRAPLLSYGNNTNRCFCIFEPSPHFFNLGIDMDDVLGSDPDSFRILRALWKLSFIKVDDREDKALLNIILKRNEYYIYSGNNTFNYDKSEHTNIGKKNLEYYQLNSYRFLKSCKNGKKINHEMAIEAAICEMLVLDNDSLFGKWDYISHQVIASPFKAIDYMDKMDIFGYKFIEGYDTISKYIVIEIKKDGAILDVIDQVMKYVDWVQSEYAHGDYSMIQAFVIAESFPGDVIKKRDDECIRYFTKGHRPTIPCMWNSVRLIRYEYLDNRLTFEEI